MKILSPGKLKIGAKRSRVFGQNLKKNCLCLKSGNLADTKHLLYIRSLKTCTFSSTFYNCLKLNPFSEDEYGTPSK